MEKAAQLQTYNLLRVALVLFKKSPAQLAEPELKQATKQAVNEFKLETRILNSSEAAAVIITEEELQRAYQEIRERYPDEESFSQDMAKNQLDQAGLMAALQRQCKVNTVLELVASRVPEISEADVGLYYHLHPEQFQRPERREVCHIFISVNADYPENTPEMALKRIQELAEQVQKKPHKFADVALRHSECPTALQGGNLGKVPSGTLYPELDAALFNLQAGQISDVVQSEIGFHILLCKHIQKPDTMPLTKAAPKIRELMQERAVRTYQRAWIADLTTS
jgi:peptidylprolyl isomerase/peptidyl-prolyl cis-trans isomerase C